MIVGCVQTSPQFGEKQANLRQIEALIGDRHADLWVMPELALTGYEFRARAEVAEFAEKIPGGESVRWLEQFCSQRNCHAVIGVAERDGEYLYNSAIIAGPKGWIGKYRKIHLFDFEFERFDRGNLPYPVIDIGVARVGVMICFDWRFPEAARTLTLGGAQIIAHPSNLVMPHCQAAMVTRALENRVFTVTTNRVGTEERDGRPVTFTGESVIIAPGGECLAKASVYDADVLTAEIDPEMADDKMVNAHNSVISDRRPEFYR
jgi:predicted amidohydrolase